jgi:hypothetical protein
MVGISLVTSGNTTVDETLKAPMIIAISVVATAAYHWVGPSWWSGAYTRAATKHLWTGAVTAFVLYLAWSQIFGIHLQQFLVRVVPDRFLYNTGLSLTAVAVFAVTVLVSRALCARFAPPMLRTGNSA